MGGDAMRASPRTPRIAEKLLADAIRVRQDVVNIPLGMAKNPVGGLGRGLIVMTAAWAASVQKQRGKARLRWLPAMFCP